MAWGRRGEEGEREREREKVYGRRKGAAVVTGRGGGWWKWTEIAKWAGRVLYGFQGRARFTCRVRLLYRFGEMSGVQIQPNAAESSFDDLNVHWNLKPKPLSLEVLDYYH
jgi:hypothetical protein